MIDGEKKVNEIQTEIEVLKSRLNETHCAILKLINKLEIKVENMIKEEDIQIIKDCKSRSEQIVQFKSTLEMVRNTVHELAQPLTVLMGRCEFLGMLPEKNPKAKKHIDSILINAKRIENTIDKIREINKMMTEYCVAENIDESHKSNGDINFSLEIFTGTSEEK